MKKNIRPITLTRKTYFSAFAINAVLSAIILLAVTGCDKENEPETITGNDTSFVVEFSASTIPLNLVDSATIILIKENATDTIIKKMSHGNNQMAVTIADLAAGNWSAMVYVYGRVSIDNYKRRYDLAKTLTISSSAASFKYQGPKGQLADDWKTRVILADNNRSVVVTIAIDPLDSYFDVVIKDPKWDYGYVDRIFLTKVAGGTSLLQGGASWECTDECFKSTGFTFDKNAFVSLPQSMLNKTWNYTEILVSIMDSDTRDERFFLYSYDK